MGSSLSFGIKNLPDCDAVLVALCDQALIPDEHYQQLINAAQTHPEHIIATLHKTCGVPAIFPQSLFTSLKELQSDQGAKSIIQNFNKVVSITCEPANFDVDTIADLDKLND